MNRFGNKFTLTTFGESHGVAVGGVIDGCPAGIILDFDAIDEALRRRREGDRNVTNNLESDTYSSLITSRQEPDTIEWISGLLEGKSLGTPIAFLVRNYNYNDADYIDLQELCRPGHADYTYQAKYGIHDWRGGGRASARETVARVIAGEIARQCIIQERLPQFTISAHPVNTCIIECTLQGVPAGIGNPIFGKLNSTLAYAMMSIPSAIGFEMGVGFAGATMSGQEWRDEWAFNTIVVNNNYEKSTKDKCNGEEIREDDKGEKTYVNSLNGITTKTNHCGGIQGGISNGMPITFRVAFHAPTTTPGIETKCLNLKDLRQTTLTPTGRHDKDQTSRLPVIVEAMACLTLMDLLYY